MLEGRWDLIQTAGTVRADMALVEAGTQVHEVVRDRYLDLDPRDIDMRQLGPTQAQIHRKRIRSRAQWCLNSNAPQSRSALKDTQVRVGHIRESWHHQLHIFQHRKGIRRQGEELFEWLMRDEQPQFRDPLGPGTDDVLKEFLTRAHISHFHVRLQIITTTTGLPVRRPPLTSGGCHFQLR